MKKDLREVYWAPNRASTEAAIDVSPRNTVPSTGRRSNVWSRDRGALLAFYDLPAEHWDHSRTSGPIENVFATERHRTVRAIYSLSPTTARLMVFNLVMAASKTWR